MTRRGLMIVLGPVLIGILVSCLLIYISILYATHDGFRVAAFLFPYGVIVSPSAHLLSILSVSLVLIQWPAYGALVGLSLRRGWSSWRLVAILLLLHTIAVAVAGNRVGASGTNAFLIG